jgi:predicted ATPase
LDALPGNLPRQPTTFVGRREDIANVVGLLGDRSLVTLTGVGGVGKTRLAIQVAAELVPAFPDGAWLCELAPVSDPAAVWDAVAASLGVYPSPGRSPEHSVLEYLAAKRLLLVLDNCEHLLDAAAQLVDVVNTRCPRVVVLATSREGLAIAGEQIVAVPALGFPREDVSLEALEAADSVRLFVDRAHSAKSDFALTERNAGAVATLCRRLDGIPLAIELAAARVRSLTPDDLVARLDQRFKLLTRGSRAALDRQRTLRNTIDWSYDLLSETERAALNRLSVFAAGCDLAAAEAVVAAGAIDEHDVADVLGQLVEKSLVVVDEDEDGARYRLGETIRQYAQERLEATGEAPDVRRCHADHYVARAEAAGPRLRAREQIATARGTARDLDNFRAALDWAAETSSADTALRLVASLAVHGTLVGYASMDWAGIAVALPGSMDHPRFPEVGSWAVFPAADRGDIETAAALADAVEAAEASLGGRSVTACVNRATLEFYRGDLEAARRHGEEAVVLARPTNDPYELGYALTIFGVAAGYSSSGSTEAVPALEEAVHIAREAGIASTLSAGLLTLAVMLPLDEVPRKFSLLDEAIEVSRTIENRLAICSCNGYKALLAAHSGEWRSALRASADAAEQQRKFGVTGPLHPSLWAAAVALVGLGYPEPAAVLVGAADAKGPAGIRRPLEDWGIEMAVSTDASLLASLGEERLAALRSRGAVLEPAEALAFLRAEAERVLDDGAAT